MSFEPFLRPFAELFDCVEDVLVWVKDREGRYQWVNRAFRIRLALDRQPLEKTPVRGGGEIDILGKTDYDFSPPFLADQFRNDDEYVLEGNRIVDRIELVGQPDGLPHWNLTNKIPLTDAHGTVVGTAGITRPLKNAQAGTPLSSGSEFGAVLAMMRDHFPTVITNRQLAKLAHLSVRAFERKFHGSFHVTPQKYLRKLRMRMASRALVYTKQTLAEVAVGTGFSDQSHFTREFRRHFGCTPRDYRERYRQG